MPTEDNTTPQPQPQPQPELTPQPLPPAPGPVGDQPPTPPLPSPQPATTNVLAIVSLVASFFVGLAGVVCGIISLTQIKRSRQSGRGLAIAGIVVGAVQMVTVALVTIGIVAAAAIGGVASVARSVDSLPGGSTSLGTALECARLAEDLGRGQTALREATSNFTSDPQSALNALSDFSDQLERSAANLEDPRVAAAAEDTVETLNGFIEKLRPIVEDPASAGLEARATVLGEIGAVTESFTNLQAACTPGD